MSAEDSILVRELKIRARKAFEMGDLKEGEDWEEIVNEIIQDPAVVPVEVRNEAAASLLAALARRKRRANLVRREVANAHGDLLRSLDECVGFADLFNRRLLKAVSRSGADLIKNKDPRPSDDLVTGAILKCVMLISLHAKACGLVTEISCLLRNGFQDGAGSRLRSLHEHLVMIHILAVDGTYEISERYQDNACFEELTHLRAYKRSFSDPMTMGHQDPALEPRVDEMIAEAQEQARQAQERWGPAIARQNEWARPILSPSKRSKPKITFVDLEEAAGMRPYRWIYLGENHRVHAGAYAAINHANYDTPGSDYPYPTQGHHDLQELLHTGWWTVNFIGRATYITSRSVASETGEFDELLYLCEMERLIEATLGQFVSGD